MPHFRIGLPNSFPELFGTCSCDSDKNGLDSDEEDKSESHSNVRSVTFARIEIKSLFQGAHFNLVVACLDSLFASCLFLLILKLFSFSFLSDKKFYSLDFSQVEQEDTAVSEIGIGKLEIEFSFSSR